MFELFSSERVAFLATTFFVIYVLYLAVLIVYRLYFSPIAKIPGPKLAAATYLYEGYYDVVKRGKYTFKIGDLHAQYGQSPHRLLSM